MREIPGHEGGRNLLWLCLVGDEPCFVLRVSPLEDRTVEEYLAETEFVHTLASAGAPVADVLPSLRGRNVEPVIWNGKRAHASMFRYAKGMLIADNGYRYRQNAPLSEYFYNTGKALGSIHRVSKQFRAQYRRQDYFAKYNMEYIDRLIPQQYAELKKAIAVRLEQFRTLPRGSQEYGLIHFDFSDGNYHVDMGTGAITVFDFDNCMYCWYLFDLANLWTHGVGWFWNERDAAKRAAGMEDYFRTVVAGYRSETDVTDEALTQLPLFIDMVLIENIVDEFECCARAGEQVDDEDIADAVRCLINGIPYAGFLQNNGE